MNNKIKVSHILHCVGGVDVSLRLILENIDSNKFENIIIHGENDTKELFYDKNKNIIKSYKVSITRDIALFKDISSIFQTYKILKKEQPKIIHAHSAKGGVIGRIVGFLLGIKVFYTPQAFSYLSTNNKIKKNIFLFIERVLIFKSNYILASSRSEKIRAIKEVGYKEDNVLLFNNSINIIYPINDLTIEKRWPDEYICTVGRPSYQKNIELMIQALYEVRKKQKIHLVVMGVGHHSDKLDDVKKLIKELNLSDAVTLIDWTDRQNIFNIISNSKFYISTARYEGLPYSVIESLALSKPCIVSNCDGNRDLIKNDYNGYVIANESIVDYVSKTIELLQNTELLKKLSFNAQKSFNENYNIKNNIVILENIYYDYSIKQ